MYPRWVDSYDLLSYPPRHYNLLHQDDLKLIVKGNYIYQLLDIPHKFTIQGVERDALVVYSSNATIKDPHPKHLDSRHKYYPLFLDKTDLQFSKLPSLEERMSRAILPTILARVKFSHIYNGIPRDNSYVEYYGPRPTSKSSANFLVWEILETAIKC